MRAGTVGDSGVHANSRTSAARAVRETAAAIAKSAGVGADGSEIMRPMIGRAPMRGARFLCLMHDTNPHSCTSSMQRFLAAVHDNV